MYIINTVLEQTVALERNIDCNFTYNALETKQRVTWTASYACNCVDNMSFDIDMPSQFK